MKFKIGDTVKIIKNLNKKESSICGCIIGIEEMIGKLYKIKNCISMSGFYFYRLDSGYILSEDCLELIKSKKCSNWEKIKENYIL